VTGSVTGGFERAMRKNVERFKEAGWLIEIPTHYGRIPFTLSL
jgi:hypothetical protein